ncbi:glycosyltransferase family 9 protein [Chitinophaga skermanii]|uniref:glycosyltransferase family 9 protein n=1 Tax=Chitinophaga skermanii TaxID=331697 RepID=UPI000DB99879|nr:glycosyltransferase family 9 protein [Chitinophaga skermanii]
MKTIVAIRFSAMGDAAMTIPVMRNVLAANPGIQIVFVTNAKWGAMCEGIPRLIFFPADLKGEHKGVPGLFKLFRQIKSRYKVSAVADLHQVLRSQIVRTFFRCTFTKVAVIDKGRAGKKALTRQENKVMEPLTTTVERYAEVFRKLGYQAPLDPLPRERKPLPANVSAIVGEKGGDHWIAIAPFATYREKMYPLAKMEAVIAHFSQQANTKILLFGGGKKEVEQLQAVQEKYPNTVLLAGRVGLAEELAVISNVDVMVSMDSANMHLASLFAVPVVSVWGATHPFAGFMGYGQSDANAVQIELSCRPCSVFGNKPCFRGDWACMEDILPSQIIYKIEQLLKK